MSTRGLWGFRKDRQDLLTYNNDDSYPEWLGREVCSFVRKMSDKEMEKLISILNPVSENATANPKDVQLFKQLKITDIIDEEADYYWLLREAQGNFAFYENLVKNPSPFMKGKKLPFIKDNTFILDSLYCEYVYILNLDNKCLEFWIGFQKKADPQNRYGTEELNGYYPCKEIAEFSFEKIREKEEESIVKVMKQCEVIPEIENSRVLNGVELWQYIEEYIPKEEIDHHGNGNGLDDLYLKKTRFSEALVDRYQYKDIVSTFTSQIDGNTWYDLPFLYPIEEMN